MYFKLNTKLAKKLLVLFNRVTDARSSMSVLGAISMTVQPQNKIDLRATDLDMDLRVTLKAKDTKPREGMCIVNCANVLKLVRKIKAPSVALSASTPKDSVLPKMILQAGKADFSIDALAPVDYPDWEEDLIETCAYVNYYGLQRVVSQVDHAASFDDARPHLSSMLFERTEDEELMCVATDGHRLALSSTDIEGFAGNVSHEGAALVSRYAIINLLHVFKTFHDSNQCTVAFGQKYMHINIVLGKDSEVESVYMKLKLNDCKFPNYKNVINKNAPKWHIIVKRNELLEAADMLSVVDNVLRIQGIGTTLMLMSQSDEMNGTQHIEGRRSNVRATQPKVEDQKKPALVMNKYIRDVLKAWSDESEVQIRMYGPLDQIHIRGVTTHPFAIVMPKRLN